MSSQQNMGRDPAKRAAKRQARREAQARIGDEALPHKGQRTGKGAPAQMDHASSSKSIKKRREGQKQMDAERERARSSEWKALTPDQNDIF